jgi:hypothetical protein
VLGILALFKIRRSDGQLKGEGLAISGIFSGAIISLLISPILMSAIQSAREAARRNTSICKMKEFTIELQNYHDVHKHFPAAGGGHGKGSQLSWRVHILPFIEENPLYAQFHLDEPWDSENNRTLIAKRPASFEDVNCNLPEGKTCYLAVTGPGTAFGDGRTAPSLRDFPHSSSHTPLVVEADADQAVIWTKPDDWKFDATNPKRGLGNLLEGGFIVGYADAHTEFIQNDTDSKTIKEIMTGHNPQESELK